MSDHPDMAELGRRALDFARHYRTLYDALIKEGVPEDRAHGAACDTAHALVFGPTRNPDPWE